MGRLAVRVFQGDHQAGPDQRRPSGLDRRRPAPAAGDGDVRTSVGAVRPPPWPARRVCAGRTGWSCRRWRHQERWTRSRPTGGAQVAQQREGVAHAARPWRVMPVAGDDGVTVTAAPAARQLGGDLVGESVAGDTSHDAGWAGGLPPYGRSTGLPAASAGSWNRLSGSSAGQRAHRLPPRPVAGGRSSSAAARRDRSAAARGGAARRRGRPSSRLDAGEPERPRRRSRTAGVGPPARCGAARRRRRAPPARRRMLAGEGRRACCPARPRAAPAAARPAARRPPSAKRTGRAGAAPSRPGRSPPRR